MIRSPLGTLFQKICTHVLSRVQSLFRIPVVMVSHDPADISAFAETLVVYDTGQVREVKHHLKQDRRPGGAVSAGPLEASLAIP